MATERTVLVRLKADPGPFVRGMTTAAAAVRGLRTEINTTNDRTAWLAQSILALGPALVPLGASAIPLLAGIAAQMTFTGAAAGVLALAFNGVGDALKALNDYQMDPTDAHLKKLDETLTKIGPEGEHLVKVLDDMGPALNKLSTIARRGVFPGVTEGLDELMTALPQAKRIVAQVAGAIGDLMADAGKGLTGPQFAEFFDMLEHDAKQTILDMGATLGNFADGVAALLVDFAPLSREFSAGFEDLSRSFADWAHSLDESATFEAFLAYIQESGPKALDLLGSMAGALIGLLHAAAPVGDHLLPVFTRFFDVLAEIVDSPLGSVFLTAAAAASVYGRAMAIAEATTGKFFTRIAPGATLMRQNTKAAFESIPTMRQWGNTLLHSMHSQEQLNTYFKDGAKRAIESRNAVVGFTRALVPTAAATALFATAASGLDKKLGLVNTTSYALMGLMIGPWTAAVGGAVGLFQDLRGSTDALETSIKAAYDAIDDNAPVDELRAKLSALKTEQDRLLHSGTGPSVWRDIQIGWAKSTGAIIDARDAQFRLNQEIEFASGPVSGISTLLTSSFNPKIKRAGEVISIAAREGQDLAASLKAIDDALSTTDTMLTYRQGLLDVQAAIKKNGATIDENNQKGLDNLKSIQSLAHDIVAVLNTMPFGPDRVQFLTGAIDKISHLANQMDPTGKLARRLREELLRVDETNASPTVTIDDKPFRKKKASIDGYMSVLEHQVATPHVDLDDKSARRKIRQLKRDLEGLVTGGYQGSIPAPGGGPSPVFPADGITVPGSRFPYQDSVPALLSPTEEVISNRYGQADRWRPFLKAINANMLADGGTVTARMTPAGWMPVTSGGGGGTLTLSDHDIMRLAAAMSKVRPVYGDAHFYGDAGATMRQMHQDRRQSSLDGIPRGPR